MVNHDQPTEGNSTEGNSTEGLSIDSEFTVIAVDSFFTDVTGCPFVARTYINRGQVVVNPTMLTMYARSAVRVVDGSHIFNDGVDLVLAKVPSGAKDYVAKLHGL